VREAARRTKKLLDLHASAHDGAWTPLSLPTGARGRAPRQEASQGGEAPRGAP
jgi:hypothetical protein